MQAVADALGVDRKALHRHVGDRDGLLELVVADVFETRLAEVVLPREAAWQELLRAYITAIRDGIVQSGSVRTHYRLTGAPGSASLALAERVLQALVQAGFSVVDAGGILAFVGEVAFSAARNALLAADASDHPQLPEVASALEALPAESFPLLGQVVERRHAHAPGEQDFDLAVRIVIAGLERLLA
jgi:AcrR family transcriptional regulator